MAMREALWSMSGVPKWLHRALDIVVSAGGFYPGGGQFLDVGEGGQLRLAAGDDGDICPGQLFQQRGNQAGDGGAQTEGVADSYLALHAQSLGPLNDFLHIIGA